MESKLYSIKKQLQLDELSQDELIKLANSKNSITDAVRKLPDVDTSSLGGEHHA